MAIKMTADGRPRTAERTEVLMGTECKKNDKDYGIRETVAGPENGKSGDVGTSVVDGLPAVSGRQSAVIPPQAFEVHIEELILHGFSGGDRYRIAEGVEREITRLLLDRGLPSGLAKDADIQRLDAGSFHVGSETQTEAVGVRVAQLVYQALFERAGK